MTIVQLRTKLNEPNILHQKLDKKSKLIELVISNGLDTSNIPDDQEDVTELQTLTNNNEKFRSFKSKENIHKKEIGTYRGFGY